MVKRANDDEVRERVAYARAMLGARLFLSDVRRKLAAKYGVGLTTADRYIKAAREDICEGTGLSRDEHRNVAVQYYARIIAESLNPDQTFPVTIRDGLQAQAQLDRLLGLHATETDAEAEALVARLLRVLAVLEPHAHPIPIPIPTPDAGADEVGELAAPSPPGTRNGRLL